MEINMFGYICKAGYRAGVKAMLDNVRYGTRELLLGT